MSSKNQVGSLDASLTFGGLVLSSYNASQLKPAIATAIEAITSTGTKTVSVESLVAASKVAPSDSTLTNFKVRIPVTLKASDVETTLKAARRAAGGQLGTALIVALEQRNMPVPANLTTGSFITVAIVEPVAAAGQTSYSCPHPKNCIPANNESLCAAGAMGPVCAHCKSEWSLIGGKCVPCSGRTGDATTWVFISVALVLGLALAIYCILPCVLEEDDDDEEEDEEDEEDEEEEDEQEEGNDAGSDFGAEDGIPLDDLNQRADDIAIIARQFSLIYARRKLADAGDRVEGLFKIILGFSQIISTLGVNLPTVPWPAFLTSVWHSIGMLANINLLQAVSVDCVTSSWTFYGSFIITISYPAILLFLMFIITMCRKWQWRGDAEYGRRAAVEGWKFSLFGLFLIYPSVCATILQVWHCRDINGTSYLVADYQLVCSTSDGVNAKWLSYAVIAAVAFVVYAIGIPALFIYLLYSNREAMHDEEHPGHKECRSKLGFLYRAYDPAAWYWECVLLMHKLLLTGLIIFIKPGTVSQLAAGFVISFFFYVLHLTTQAYVDNAEYDLQTNAMLSITMTLFGGILLKTDTQDEDSNGLAIMGAMMIIVNVGVVVAFCYTTIMAIRNPPVANKPARTVALRIVQAALDEVQPRVTRACVSLGLSEEEAVQLKDILLSLQTQIPEALATMKDIEAVVQEAKLLQLASAKPQDMVDSLFKLTKLALGNARVQDALTAYSEMLMDSFEESLQGAGCSEEILSQCRPLALKLVRFIMAHGLNAFTIVWVNVGSMIIDANGGAAGAVAQLDELLGMAPDIVVTEDDDEPAAEYEDDDAPAAPACSLQPGVLPRAQNAVGLTADRRAIVAAKFEQYDYDGSGTINTAEELTQITTTTCCKLSLGMDPELIYPLCNSTDVVENPMNLEEYIEWLLESGLIK